MVLAESNGQGSLSDFGLAGLTVQPVAMTIGTSEEISRP